MDVTESVSPNARRKDRWWKIMAMPGRLRGWCFSPLFPSSSAACHFKSPRWKRVLSSVWSQHVAWCLQWAVTHIHMGTSPSGDIHNKNQIWGSDKIIGGDNYCRKRTWDLGHGHVHQNLHNQYRTTHLHSLFLRIAHDSQPTWGGLRWSHLRGSLQAGTSLWFAAWWHRQVLAARVTGPWLG